MYNEYDIMYNEYNKSYEFVLEFLDCSLYGILSYHVRRNNILYIYTLL